MRGCCRGGGGAPDLRECLLFVGILSHQTVRDTIHCTPTRVYIYMYTYVCETFVLFPTFLFVRAFFDKTLLQVTLHGKPGRRHRSRTRRDPCTMYIGHGVAFIILNSMLPSSCYCFGERKERKHLRVSQVCLYLCPFPPPPWSYAYGHA